MSSDTSVSSLWGIYSASVWWRGWRNLVRRPRVHRRSVRLQGYTWRGRRAPRRRENLHVPCVLAFWTCFNAERETSTHSKLRLGDGVHVQEEFGIPYGNQFLATT